MQIFIQQNGQQAGPFSVEHICSMVAARSIASTYLGWHAGMSDWQPLHTFLPTPAHSPALIPAPASSSASNAEVCGKSFGKWYWAHLGRQSRLVQIVLWVLYGFIWIPLWWAFSKNSPPSARRFAFVAIAWGLLILASALGLYAAFAKNWEETKTKTLAIPFTDFVRRGNRIKLNELEVKYAYTTQEYKVPHVISAGDRVFGGVGSVICAIVAGWLLYKSRQLRR